MRVGRHALLVTAFALGGRPATLLGQAAATDTAAPVRDPSEALGIYRPPRPPPERVDSAAPRGAAVDSAARSRAAVVNVPVDSALARACQGSEVGAEAPGILAVAFRPGTAVAARAAAAKAVDGRLAGPTWYGGEEYVLVPTTRPLTALADGLIRQGPVMQVSPVACPPPRPGSGNADDGSAPPCPTSPSATGAAARPR
jgi:hypothetical protein